MFKTLAIAVAAASIAVPTSTLAQIARDQPLTGSAGISIETIPALAYWSDEQDGPVEKASVDGTYGPVLPAAPDQANHSQGLSTPAKVAVGVGVTALILTGAWYAFANSFSTDAD